MFEFGPAGVALVGFIVAIGGVTATYLLTRLTIPKP